MPACGRTMMCDECPFRPAASPGWLGPHTAGSSTGTARNDAPVICHPDIRDMKDECRTDDEIEEEGQGRVGAMRHINSQCKLSIDPVRAACQARLKTRPDRPVIPARKLIELHQGASHAKDRPDGSDPEDDDGAEP